MDSITKTDSSSLTAPICLAIGKLGTDLRDARLRRRIPSAVMAQRASISRTTLHRAEKGDPNVSMGTYATLLFITGLLPRLAELADVKNDYLGLQLDEERLPKRIHLPKDRKIKS